MQDDLQAGLDLSKVASELRDHHLKRIHYEAGDTIFNPGDPSDDIYIIEQGSVSLKTNFVSFTNQDERPVSVCLGNGQAEFEQTPSAPDRFCMTSTFWLNLLAPAPCFNGACLCIIFAIY